MPLVCGVIRGMRTPITRTVEPMIIAMKILVLLISVSIVPARTGTRAALRGCGWGYAGCLKGAILGR